MAAASGGIETAVTMVTSSAASAHHRRKLKAARRHRAVSVASKTLGVRRKTWQAANSGAWQQRHRVNDGEIKGSGVAQHRRMRNNKAPHCCKHEKAMAAAK
jgi:hypothetical protein